MREKTLKKGPIALIGAGGQLGQDLQKLLPKKSLRAFCRPELDVLDFARVREILVPLSPSIVINTTAFNRVDDCEREVASAFSVNAFAVRNLAEVCRELGCPLVHFSTDYVFDGLKGTPYMEEDPPRPLSIYGASKLLGESLIRATWEQHFIVRTSALFGISGSSGKGGNFVETMLRLARDKKPIRVVSNQVTSPTFTGDLAAAALKFIEGIPFGTYHLTNNGSTSWLDFARAIFKAAGLSPNLSPISSRDFGAPARRPAYSVLENQRWKGLGFKPLAPWEEGLKRYLERRVRGIDG